MKCPVCKTHNDDGAEMCSRCGASLTEHQTEETSSKKRSSISIAHIILRIFLVVFYGGLLIIFGGRMIKKTVGSEESNPSYDITAENMEPVGWQQVKEDIDQNRETIEADTKERLDELQQQINIISAQEEAISALIDSQDADQSSDFAGEYEKGDIYKNSILGYGCKLKNWIFLSEEEIAEVNGYRDNLPEDLEQLIERSGFVIVMAAQSNTMDQEVNINICDMKSQYGDVYTQEELELLLPSMLPDLKTNYEKAGFTNVTVEVTDIDFAGDTYKGILVTSEVSGSLMYQKQLALCIGNYSGVITASSFGKDTTDQIFAHFYPMR